MLQNVSIIDFGLGRLKSEFTLTKGMIMPLSSREPVKLIYHNASNISHEDDFSYPFKLEVNLRPPDFMIMTFISMFGGSEVIVARGLKQDAFDVFINTNQLRTHPRLRRMTISGPDGIIESIDTEKPTEKPKSATG